MAYGAPPRTGVDATETFGVRLADGGTGVERLGDRVWIADLLGDVAVLEEARRDAQALVTADPGLAQPQHALLRRMTITRYGQALDLGDVG